MKSFTLPALCIAAMAANATARAQNSEFSALTYNVTGLPELLSSAESDRQVTAGQISC